MKTTLFLCDLVHDFRVSFGSFSDNESSRLNTFVVVPLNIANLAAYAHHRFPGELDITLFKYPEVILERLEREKPDILGFSNYNWNRDINLKVAAFAKEKYPGLTVVMGGPDIRIDRAGIQGFLQKNKPIDVYVMFQGEVAFAHIIKAWKTHGRDFLENSPELPGCAYLSHSELVYEKASAEDSLNDIPSPYLTGILDEFLVDGLIPLFETNRGCPYQCAFCAWGVSALNKVRCFPLKRVMAEMDYVARRFPRMPAWVFADANFGMFERDVQIAEKICDIRKQTPGLREVRVWDAKGFPDRVVEINALIGKDQGEILYAVQTLDPAAQKAVRRDNILLEDIAGKVRHAKDRGLKVITHIIAPLPGERFEAQMETLRRCFDMEFDGIYIMAPVILAGTEMESLEYRLRYGLVSRFNTRQFNYGDYRGIKSIEWEEVIYKTGALTEEQAGKLKIIHWLIWYGWCYEHLKPLWVCAHKTAGINPIDLILEIAEEHSGKYPAIQGFFNDFMEESARQSFESEEALKDYYYTDSHWQSLIDQGIVRAAHLYNAKMTLDRAVFQELVALIIDCVNRKKSGTPIEDIGAIVIDSRLYPEDLLAGDFVPEKRKILTKGLAGYFMRDSQSIQACDDTPSIMILHKSAEDVNGIITALKKGKDVLTTVEYLIRNNYRLFNYHMDVFNKV